MTTRRHFLLACGALALPGGARAQGRPPVRVGILRPALPIAPGDTSAFERNLEGALKEAAAADGRTVLIAARHAGGDVHRLPALARELVAMPCDVIVAVGSSAAIAARDASGSIPVVLFGNFDPVRSGLVTSLSRPGRNLTGVLIAAGGTLAPKRLELLREAVPNATRIAMLVPDDPGFRQQIPEATRAADALGIALPIVTVRAGYDSAFAAIAAERVQAVFVGATTFFVRDRHEVIARARSQRLPTSFEWPEQAEEGGFMAYGASVAELYQRVADYVLRIVRGADPGAMAFEQPASYQLVFNLATARAVGVAIPQSLLLRADRVFS